MEFRDATWARVALVGALKRTEDEWAAIASLGRSFGDETVIVTDFEPLPPHQFTEEIDWSFEAMERISFRSNLGIVDGHMFGRSGSWGALLLHDLWLLVVGADPGSIARLTDAMGGEARLRAEFDEFMRDLRPSTDSQSIWPGVLSPH